MFNLTQNSMGISLTTKENPASLFALGLLAYEWPQAVRDELKELRCNGLGHFVKPNEWHTHCNCIDVRKGSETPTGLFAVHYKGDKWPVFASEQPAAFSRTDKLYYFVLTANHWLAVSTAGRQQAFEWGKR